VSRCSMMMERYRAPVRSDGLREVCRLGTTGWMNLDETAEHAELTRSERRVLRVLGAGEPHRKVAEALGVELSTVRWHVRNLHAKTETSTPVSLALWGLAHEGCCAAA